MKQRRKKKKSLIQLVLPAKSFAPMGDQSEVARIRAQITAEQESAQRALHSIAYGTTQHQFITRRMERMGQLQGELETLVGEERATQITVQAMGAEVVDKKKESKEP
jgi:hypothetical protein